jgi:uncharacterized membrane protein affecting hemolysin expression
MLVSIIVCAVVVWLAASLLVALLFGRAVKMADVKHRDAMFVRDLAKQPARQIAHSR